MRLDVGLSQVCWLMSLEIWEFDNLVIFIICVGQIFM
jgi:hypothetical protein